MAGIVAGVVAGAAIAAIAVACVATGGLAAALIPFFAGAVGGFVGAAVGGGVSKTGSKSGKIKTGSPNVYFEGKKVARVTDQVECEKHPNPLPQIAEGSKTISVNSLPLARIGHKITCSAVIQEGCRTIFADQTTGQYGPVDADLSIGEQLLITGFEVFTARSSSKKGGLFDKVLRKLFGEPVDAATGEYADYRCDFTYPHVLPITLDRSYAGHTPVRGLFGERWICSWSQRLEFETDAAGAATVVYYDPEGQQLVYPAAAERFDAINVWAPYYRLGGSRQRPWVFDERSQRTHMFAPAADANSTARLIRTEDRNGNYIDYDYNALGHLWRVRHSNGFTLQVRCNTDGLLESVSHLQESPDAPAAPLVDYRYRGRLLTDVSSRFEGEFHFGYSPEGWLNHWHDSGPTEADLLLDEQGRVIATRTNSELYADRFEYLPAAADGSHATIFINALGERHESRFDAHNRLISSTDPLGRCWQTEYDESGWPLQRKDPLGRITTYRHDGHGRLLAITDPHGRSVRLSWNEQGQLLSLQGPEGPEQWHHDPQGNVVAWQVEGRETRYRYTTEGLLSQETGPDGAVSRWHYDARGALCRHEDPLGQVTEFQLDAYLRLGVRTDPLGHATRYDYTPGPDNPRESVRSVLLPDGGRHQYRYDREGLLQEYRSPLGHLTRYRHGAFDLLQEEIDSLGHATHYLWDAAARLRGVRNALGQEWHYQRDAAGQIVGETDWAGRQTRFERNLLGQIVRRQRPDGSTLQYAYDERDRLVRIAGSSQVHHFIWDGLDRLVGARVEQLDPEGPRRESELELAYDAAHRLLRETQDGLALVYARDAAGRLSGLTTPAGERAWQYDQAGQVAGYRSNRHHFDFTYDPRGLETACRYRDAADPTAGASLPRSAGSPAPAGPLAGVSSPGGPVRPTDRFFQEQRHDPNGRLLQQRGGAGLASASTADAFPGQQLDYRWDQDGRCTDRSASIQGQLRQHTHYDYDARDQVVQATRRHPQQGGYEREESEHFRYDPLQHLTHREVRYAPALDANLSAQSFAYRADELIEAGPWRYRYDACGRLVERTETRPGFRPRTWRYHWNEFDHLRRLETPEGEHWHYRYDVFGRRIAKFCSNPGEATRRRHGTRETYLWMADRLIESRRFGPDRELLDTTLWHYRAERFDPLAREVLGADDSRCYPIASDPNGTPHTLYNSQGQIVWQAGHNLWGSPRERDYGSELQPTRYPETVPDCPLRFPGQWADPESGLHYNLHRYYDPHSGQYLSPDPIGLAGGLRTHAYVHDPLQWVDPWGLAGCSSRDSITRGSSGEILSVKGRIEPNDLGTGTQTNASSRSWVRSLGKATDDAGHTRGSQLGGNGGKKYVFPQEPHINRGSFQAFEGKIADYVSRTGRTVEFEQTYHYGNGGTRPTGVTYTVKDGGVPILGGPKYFPN